MTAPPFACAGRTAIRMDASSNPPRSSTTCWHRSSLSRPGRVNTMRAELVFGRGQLLNIELIDYPCL